MDEKIEYLNDIVGKKDIVYKGPTKLYKYRPFDEFTFDMLKNNYVFLCKVSNLDDPTECKVTTNEENYYDIANDCLRRTAVDRIVEMLRPYTSPENFELVRSTIYKVLTPDFKIRRNYLIDVSFEIEKFAPEIGRDKLVQLVNELVNIPEMLDKSEYGDQIKSFILAGLKARDVFGVCSLAENPDIEYMWENYAQNNTGYCIEYDLSDYDVTHDIYPVVYEDDRETNMVYQVVDTFICQLIENFSDGQIRADKTKLIRLFVTKDKKWEYQKEWRIIGEANEKITAPKITRVICGNNVSKENLELIKNYCLKSGIKLEARK